MSSVNEGKKRTHSEMQEQEVDANASENNPKEDEEVTYEWKRNRLTGPSCIQIVPPGINLFHIVVPKQREREGYTVTATHWDCDWIKPGSACVTDGRFLYYQPNLGDVPSFDERLKIAARRLQAEQIEHEMYSGASELVRKQIYACKYEEEKMQFVGYFVPNGEVVCIMDEIALKKWRYYDFNPKIPHHWDNSINQDEYVYLFFKVPVDRSGTPKRIWGSSWDDKVDFKLLSCSNPLVREIGEKASNGVIQQSTSGRRFVWEKSDRPLLWSVKLFKQWIKMNGAGFPCAYIDDKGPDSYPKNIRDNLRETIKEFRENEPRLCVEEYDRRAMQKYLEDFCR